MLSPWNHRADAWFTLSTRLLLLHSLYRDAIGACCCWVFNVFDWSWHWRRTALNVWQSVSYCVRVYAVCVHECVCLWVLRKSETKTKCTKAATAATGAQKPWTILAACRIRTHKNDKFLIEVIWQVFAMKAQLYLLHIKPSYIYILRIFCEIYDLANNFDFTLMRQLQSNSTKRRPMQLYVFVYVFVCMCVCVRHARMLLKWPQLKASIELRAKCFEAKLN